MLASNDVLIRAMSILGTGIVAVAGAASVHAFYEIATHKVKRKTKMAWAFAMFALAVNAWLVSLSLLKLEDLRKATDELKAERPIETRYYPAADAYGEMRRVIGEAKEGGTIYVLNSFEVPFRGIEDDTRKRYFALIEEKMRHVNYKRLIQIRDSETLPIGDLIGPTYIDHFKKVIALQDRPDGDVVTSLQVARAQFSLSFVIVENPGGSSYLIWQIDKRVVEEDGYKPVGYLIVTDPQQLFIRHFRALFNQIAQGPNVRRVRLDDLKTSH